MTPTNCPSVWPSVGMIAGVTASATHWPPSTQQRGTFAPSLRNCHWPIVLVGFLGKVFGLIGLIQKIWLEGELPLGFGWINVFNDLIWLVPFFLALRWVLRKHKARGKALVQW